MELPAPRHPPRGHQRPQAPWPLQPFVLTQNFYPAGRVRPCGPQMLDGKLCIPPFIASCPPPLAPTLVLEVTDGGSLSLPLPGLPNPRLEHPFQAPPAMVASGMPRAPPPGLVSPCLRQCMGSASPGQPGEGGEGDVQGASPPPPSSYSSHLTPQVSRWLHVAASSTPASST